MSSLRRGPPVRLLDATRRKERLSFACLFSLGASHLATKTALRSQQPYSDIISANNLQSINHWIHLQCSKSAPSISKEIQDISNCLTASLPVLVHDESMNLKRWTINYKNWLAHFLLETWLFHIFLYGTGRLSEPSILTLSSRCSPHPRLTYSSTEFCTSKLFFKETDV